VTPEKSQSIVKAMTEVADGFFHLLVTMQGHLDAFELADTAFDAATRKYLKFARENLNLLSEPVRSGVVEQMKVLESRKVAVGAKRPELEALGSGWIQ
jgi:hypothetical protein